MQKFHLDKLRLGRGTFLPGERTADVIYTLLVVVKGVCNSPVECIPGSEIIVDICLRVVNRLGLRLRKDSTERVYFFTISSWTSSVAWGETAIVTSNEGSRRSGYVGYPAPPTSPS